MRRILAFLAAAGMAVAPVAASAQDASPLSLAGASTSAPASSGLSFFAEEGGGGSTAVILGVVLVVLIGVAVISGNGDRPASP